jgi:hypothetical protein
LEFSNNIKDWMFCDAWNEEEAPEKWKSLMEWVEADQVYGFFRLTREGYVDE